MCSSAKHNTRSPVPDKAAGPVIDSYRELFVSNSPLIDVRAPIEFVKGAFPGAVNLPLLNDEERHLVGVRYKELGQDSAIELGAELVNEELKATRVHQWLQYVKENPGCALYCFRGGLRSRISQQWLLEQGVEIPLVRGGYKAMRRYLIDNLSRFCQTFSFKIIGGRTGNGKTNVLRRFRQSIDLEELARHRGSSFGSLIQKQPSNIDFENALAIEFLKLENIGSSTVILEDEARLIGRVCLPDSLRAAMQESPLFILECDMETRINNCFDDYVTRLLKLYVDSLGEEAGFAAYSQHHKDSLERIRKRLGEDNYSEAMTMLERSLSLHQLHGDTSTYREVIQLLLQQYYDPMYDYQLKQKQHRIAYSGTEDQLLVGIGAD